MMPPQDGTDGPRRIAGYSIVLGGGLDRFAVPASRTAPLPTVVTRLTARSSLPPPEAGLRRQSRRSELRDSTVDLWSAAGEMQQAAVPVDGHPEAGENRIAEDAVDAGAGLVEDDGDVAELRAADLQ